MTRARRWDVRVMRVRSRQRLTRSAAGRDGGFSKIAFRDDGSCSASRSVRDEWVAQPIVTEQSDTNIIITKFRVVPGRDRSFSAPE